MIAFIQEQGIVAMRLQGNATETYNSMEWK